MNVYDSLKIQELLGSIGFSDSSSFFDADLIILNTCHIREKATEKVYSELGKIKKSFKNDIEFGRKIIAVMGCVAQAEGDEIFKRTPYVDIVIGPQSIHNLPILVTEAMERRNKRKSLKLIDVDFPARNKFNYFKHNKPQGASAYITIQEGCDKFCNFCVVPYTRGEEFSRPIEDVYVEANNLVALGSREIILLGQNVTAYHGKDFSGKEQGIHKLIEKLSGMVDPKLYNSTTKSNANYPTPLEEFENRQEEFSDMFDRIIKQTEVKEVGISQKKQFVDNMNVVFSGAEPHIANIKLMQMYFIDKVLHLNKIKRNEFLTDLLFVSQKKGDKVFDFGPFGKLY